MVDGLLDGCHAPHAPTGTMPDPTGTMPDPTSAMPDYKPDQTCTMTDHKPDLTCTMSDHKPDPTFTMSDHKPEQTGTMPDHTGTMLDQTGNMADQIDIMPHQTGAMPDQTGTMPHQTGTMPHQTGTMPNQTGAMPDQTGTMVHQTVTMTYVTGVIADKTVAMETDIDKCFRVRPRVSNALSGDQTNQSNTLAINNLVNTTPPGSDKGNVKPSRRRAQTSQNCIVIESDDDDANETTNINNPAQHIHVIEPIFDKDMAADNALTEYPPGVTDEAAYNSLAMPTTYVMSATENVSLMSNVIFVPVDTESVRFTCSYCEEPFLLQKDFLQHVITHPKDRPYQCRYCGQTFRKKTYWEDHKKVHPANMM